MAYQQYLSHLRMNKSIDLDDPHGKFWKTPRNRKFINQNFGYHSIESIPRILATKCLNISQEDSLSFTSHSFRRSGATILAEAGATDRQIATVGAWGSSKIVSEYVDRATTNLAALTGKILGKSSDSGSFTSSTSSQGSSDDDDDECRKNVPRSKRPRDENKDTAMNFNSSKLDNLGFGGSFIFNVSGGGIIKIFQ
jgi:hypothetical protein